MKTWIKKKKKKYVDVSFDPPTFGLWAPNGTPTLRGIYHVNRFKNLTFIGAFTSRVPSVITGEGGWRGWVMEGGMLR